MRKNIYIILFVIISATVSVLMHFPEIISLIDQDPVDFFPGMSVADVASEVIFTFFSLLLLYSINIWLLKLGGTYHSVTWKRMLFSFVLTWTVSNILWRLFLWIHTMGILPAVEAVAHNYLHPLRDFIITLIVVGSSYIVYLIRRSRKMQTEYQSLQAENLINKYEALKNQLNPHMMFNSLNTLRSLIPESPVKAQDYVQELSRVLRYTLQENQHKNVTLREEMDFVRSFIFLLKMRYEDNLTFDIRIKNSYDEYVVPPMSVQLLIENAVKHNEISNRNPLTIRVETQGKQLTVSNPLQPKRTPYAGLGIGLANLNKRYQLMFKEEISVKNENSVFSVTIPLI